MGERALIFLTDFADQAVILPLLAVTAVILLLQRRWHLAFAWSLAIAAVLGTLLVLKVACSACGWLVPAFGPTELDLHSPSGHAAASAVTYGALVALLAGVRPGLPSRALALTTALAVAILIGLTRLQLGAHSLAEVLLGASVGIAGAAAFVYFAGADPAGSRNRSVLFGAVLVVTVFHGHHLPAEAVIQDTAGDMLRRWIVSCQADPSLALPGSGMH